MSLLSRIFGVDGPLGPESPAHSYTCDCGAEMEMIAEISYNDHVNQTWECTSDECEIAAQCWFFEDDDIDDYGKGPLRGQIQ